jgi:flagellar hook-associated protein 3 FlgL
MYLTVARNLQTSLGKVQDLQARLSSGRRINVASDAPADAAAALRLRAEEEDWASYGRVAEDARAWLDTADTALQSVSAALRRVRELTLAAVNSSRSQTERDAIANEIDQLREQVRAAANTTYLGRSIFGGFAAAAVDASGAWVGTPASMSDPPDRVLRQVSPTDVVAVNLDGRAVFGFDQGPGADLFSVLGRIAADVRAGDTTALAGADLAALDARMSGIGEALATVGGRTNQVDAARERGATQIETLRRNRSNLEDADLAETVMQLQMAQAAYQATLGATAQLGLPSLADFLR